MIYKSKRKLNFIAVSVLLFGSALLIGGLPSSKVSAAEPGAQKACDTLKGFDVDCDTSKTTGELVGGPVSTVTNLLSFVVGGASVIMIILGGFKFITSGGNADKTKAATKTITYALVGLAVVVLAQFLVRFVFSKSAAL